MSLPLHVSIQNKTYSDSATVALQDTGFSLSPGEIVSILGPSGCGKSTLLKLIVGLDSEYQGTITLGTSQAPASTESCGIVFQEPRLLPWLTVEENIAFGAYNDKGKNNIAEQLQLLALTQFKDVYPRQLSGGMAQKVALARALINVPQLLLLDEPFGSLDQITKGTLQEETAKVLAQEKSTVLLVTHDVEEAIYLSDRILIMSPRPGKIIHQFIVELPKPRVRSSIEFVTLQASILEYMSKVFK